MTKPHDLNELRICTYEAISSKLDRCLLPHDKISVALAVAIDEHLDDETGASIDCFIRELARCVAQQTGAIIRTARDANIDVDAAEARMEDEDVEDLYIVLNETTLPEGILDYEDGDERRNPPTEAYAIALAFAVAMCLKHDTARVERFIQDLHAERSRAKIYQAKYSPAWRRRPLGNA